MKTRILSGAPSMCDHIIRCCYKKEDIGKPILRDKILSNLETYLLNCRLVSNVPFYAQKLPTRQEGPTQSKMCDHIKAMTRFLHIHKIPSLNCSVHNHFKRQSMTSAQSSNLAWIDNFKTLVYYRSMYFKNTITLTSIYIFSVHMWHNDAKHCD